MRVVRIHSNVPKLDAVADARPGTRVDVRAIGRAAGWRHAIREYLAARDADAIVLDNDVGLLIKFCALSFLVPRRARLVSVDIVLGRPKTPRARLAARVHRLLLSRIDRFVLFQHDLEGYARYFGVTPDRVDVVRFKANLWERLQQAPIPTADDGYLLFVGRTYRDPATFIEACAIAGVPAALVRHSADLARQHGTDVGAPAALPPNLREIVHDEGRESWVDLIARSTAVVIPIQADVICCAGISTVYDAMALGKPVIMSRCPATNGVLDDSQLVLVPPGDAAALADAMRRVHEDPALRARLVARGREVVAAVQGEARLRRDVLGAVLRQVSPGAAEAAGAERRPPGVTSGSSPSAPAGSSR